MKVKDRTLEQIAWMQNRGVCSVMDKGSLKSVTYCSHFGNKQCPKDCRLYEESKNGKS